MRRACPRSASFGWPLAVIRMFCGLMSRCAMPRECTNASAASTGVSICSTRGSPNGACALA
eukprot:7380297-Prymnesium_polylepis.5